MKNSLISSAQKLGKALDNYYTDIDSLPSGWREKMDSALKEATLKNSWFTPENLKFAWKQWASSLEKKSLELWLSTYEIKIKQTKKIGLILAGNLPMVGFHDILCVLFSGHEAVIKLSSKDSVLIPLILELWQFFSEEKLAYSLVEKLEEVDAVIATGSNNTAQYLSYYFRDLPHIIRKNRTSVAVLDGTETDEEIQLLAGDIFTYFGMGCRNVTRLFIPENFDLARLFENFVSYGEIIHHHAYANNYDYNKAIFLLNQDNFWDNNFVMLRESENLFSPLSVLHFSRYKNIAEVSNFIKKHEEDIQCVVGHNLDIATIPFGKAQAPSLQVYADNVDTMSFLLNLS